MDPGTFAGIALALGCLFGSMVMEGGNPAAIIAPGPIILVFGGTFGVAMASGLLKDATGIMAILKGALLAKKHEPDEPIKQVVSFAERARREGLLALEEAAKTIDDPFLKKAIELKRTSEIEVHHRELLLEGILSIQAGANPRVIEQKLLTYLAPKEREALDKSKAA